MFNRVNSSILLMSLIVVICLGNLVNAQAKLTDRSQVFINSIGPIRVGMTVNQAAQAAGTKLVQIGSGGEEGGCLYFQPQREPKGVSFMVINNRIARIDIRENKRITTGKGAKIGDTETRIKSLYPGQIQVTPHKYVQNGHYLTFVPKDSVDKNYRLLFETDGTRVTQYRAGKLPEVEFVEGCL
ncbi:hypothetical protein IQ264_21185 [Phormidium sp. LEGE 05292]|uniref:hypothetical protein n=1 Tax=[Phormidium] sp. LEGE 05292 TaxID=767427 RepID=UPI001880CFC1|nr:hypothetical protein [Phormidium sp. LEGE 05292]MBE9227940.1 hypothetical protein [Phormidium sp. LEGE 05292]